MKSPKMHSQELHKDLRGYSFKFPTQSSKPDASEHQIFISFNNEKGTFRGMHWQEKPFPETKFVAVLNGKILDFVVNIDMETENFGEVFKFEISNNGNVLEIPPMHAHGYLTLTDDVTVVYGIQGTFDPNRQRGFRWDDPFFRLELPFEPSILAPHDISFPNFQSRFSN